MLPDTSKTFLDQCKQQGMKFEEVAGQLSQGGWSPEQIELAKNYYGPEAGKPETPVFPTLSPTPAPAPDPTPNPNPNPESIPSQDVLPPLKTTNASAMPEVSVISTNSSAKKESFDAIPMKKNGGLKAGLFILFGIIFLLAATGVPAYFVATEKLNIGSDAFKKTVANLVFSIPFITKTPKYILQSTADVHKKLSKNSFDVSVAVQSESFTSSLGTNSLDAQLKGYVDYADTKNPRLALTVNVTKDFSAQVKKNDKMIYFKIDKLPLGIVMMAGLDPTKLSAITDNWIGYDSTPLETEARKSLDSMSKPTSPTEESVMQFLTKLMNEQILPQLKVTNEKLDKFSTYKLRFAPSDQVLDKIADEMNKEAENQAKKSNANLKIPVTDTQSITPTTPKDKVSDHIKNLDVQVWIDSSQYYLRKATMTFAVIPETSTGGFGMLSELPIPMNANSPGTVSIALVMSDFGSTLPVEVPSKSLTPEEFYKQLMETSSLYKAIDPTTTLAKANNTKRRSDTLIFLNGISQYEADNKGKLPAGISTTVKNISKKGADICSALMPMYLAALPTDPSNTEEKITTCAGDYDTGYTVIKSATNNRVTVSAPAAELGEVISTTR